jgi:hypothetical protein
MRDSKDPNVRFLWERMLISTRPDPSDSGMAWFLVTGDEEANPEKLKQLLDGKTPQQPVAARKSVRLEAENFQLLDGCKLEDRNDRTASHRLNIIRSRDKAPGSLRTRVDQPYAPARGRFDVDVRYLAEPGESFQCVLQLNGSKVGEAFKSTGDEKTWATHTIRDVAIQTGDEIGLEIVSLGRVDYIELNERATVSSSTPATTKRFVATGKLDDPAALPGQIIVSGSKPGYLKYNGGRVAYLCGPDMTLPGSTPSAAAR